MTRSHVERLGASLSRPAHGSFTDAEIACLPEPVQRMFHAVIAPGTPLAETTTIQMHGEIRLKDWTSFAATEILNPHEGFVWSGRAGLVSGFDRYVGGAGEMRWRLFGIVPVAHATGEAIDRGAAGRAVAEGVWLPTALLPRFGVDWRVADDDHLVAAAALDGRRFELHIALDEHDRIAACWFHRWGDPDATGAPDFHPFGMESMAFATYAGMTIPSVGQAGWHYGTSRWEDGIFFRYVITDLIPTNEEAS